MTGPSLHRPTPIASPGAPAIPSGQTLPRIVTRLQAGERLLLDESYQHGQQVLDALWARLDLPGPGASFAERQRGDATWVETASRLLIPIRNHKVGIPGAPYIGFLSELYPEGPDFALPLLEVFDLHKAWQHYQNGTQMAVLGHRIHPFYGTYAPTRVSHLELFGTWLSQYGGPRVEAVDVGTGCGVLALMLAKAGFGRVRATDINPNAIESLNRELKRFPARPAVLAEQGDMLGSNPTLANLIVFNPPWIKGPVRSPLDQALFFEDGFFERFFDQAHARLRPEGRVVLIFSNVLQLVLPEEANPIEAELQQGRFRLVQKLSRKVKPPGGRPGPPRRTKERVEIWELARQSAG